MAAHDPGVSQAMTVEPFACTEVLKILWFAVLFLLLSLVVDLASRLDAYSLTEGHATGSTVRLVSRVTEMSNRLTSSREDGHYVNIVQVGNAHDGLCHEITIPFVHHTIEVDLSVRPPGSGPHSACSKV